MRICIIESDHPATELQPKFGTYASMLAHWLGKALPEARFFHSHVEGGEPLPDPSQVDGVLLSGSRHSVYDRLEWVEAVKTFLVKLRELGTPVGGICFGHQLMAEAYGGKVERCSRGWAVGRHTHEATPAGLNMYGGRREIAALSYHQDQIVRLPEAADVTLHNSHSPFGGLRYHFPAMSVQFHPEFSPAYVEALLDSGSGKTVPAQLASTAREGLWGELDADIVGGAFAAFYRRSE